MQKIRMELPEINANEIELNKNRICPEIIINDFDSNKVGAWEEIQFASDLTLNKKDRSNFLAKQLGTNFDQIKARLFFAKECGTNKLVGSCTAWMDNEWGRVHWVAVLPEFQGRGIANNLMCECLSRLRVLGHRKAYLHTWSDRHIAIKLYKKFGFIIRDNFFIDK